MYKTTKNGTYRSGSFTQYKKTLFKVADGLLSDKVNKLIFDADGVLYAATDNGLCRKENGRFIPVFDDVFAGETGALALVRNGVLAAAEGRKLYYIENGKVRFVREFDSAIVDIYDFGGDVWVLTEQRIVRTDFDAKTDKVNRPLEGGMGLSLAVSEAGIYVATENSLSVVHGKRQEWKNIMPRFCNMPADHINALCFDGAGYLWLSTDGGAVIHDNANLWLTPEKLAALPKNAVYKTVTDEVGGRYFATDVGVIYQKNGKLKHFCAERWVPADKVNDVAVSKDGKFIYAATDCGIAEINAYQSTLAEKAAFHEDFIEKYHIRRGFLACSNYINDDPTTAKPYISDNDGLWTACYVAAESYRYAVTGEKDALEKARRGLNAMLLLTRITEIDGFTARAVRYPGEEGFNDGNHEWVKTSDGECEWKCETSSDEMTGHFFGMSTYYDLCADESEKEEIRVALCKIVDHIVRNGYRLIDHDGLPTTWANWNPELLNYDDKWFAERGINSLELLAFLKVAYHISGDEKYKALYGEFVSRHHYPLNVTKHKVRDAHICHIDDNLGFLAMLTLLRLEENESLRSLYLCGMEDHWEYERIEKQPLFCFIHAAFSGRDDDLCEGVQSLREMPCDMCHYRMSNSKRKDIVYDTEQAEWFEEAQPKYPLPYDERNLCRPDGGVFELDCGERHSIQDGVIFLLPYWIARFYGLLDEE